MSTVVLDAGALVAVDRADRAMIARLRAPVDQQAGRDAGILLGVAGTADPVEATVVLLAGPGDRILTSDPADLTRLTEAAARRAIVVAC